MDKGTMSKFIQHFALPMLAMLLPALCVRADVVVSIKTDKPEYYPGEAINFLITVTNTSPRPTTLKFTGTQAMYMLMEKLNFTYPDYNTSLGLEEQTRTLEGNGSFTWTIRHRWQMYELEHGDHEVVARVNAVGLSASQPYKFKIVDPPAPTTSYVVNFDTLPNSEKKLVELDEYRAWCVEFKIIKSLTGELNLTRLSDTNRCLEVTRAALPTGYNIAADLTGVVTGVAAEISTRPGASVRMVIKNDRGDVLKEQSTPVFTQADRGKFKPLKLEVTEKDVWINAVEFWPSDPSVPLMIDNLAITVPKF
jgi:hypothetical protein